MIKVNNVSKWYGRKHAVDGVSFEVKKGEVLGFIGPNGAGKSTTMRMITGFIPISVGTITIGGNDVESSPIQAKKLVGYLPENAPLYDNKTVLEFLRFTAELRGFDGSEREKRVQKAIDRCFLEPVKNQSIDTLSKGYRHRTAFAQAIIHDPEVLILDEPTDGLDPNQKREVRNLIKEMGKEKAIIISTHILEEVEAVADRVVLISGGHKVFDGTPEEFKSKSREYDTVRLTVGNSEQKDVKEALDKLDSIQSISVDDIDSEHVRFIIKPKPTATREKLRDSIADIIKAEQWSIKEFCLGKGQLDEVFCQITQPKREEN